MGTWHSDDSCSFDPANDYMCACAEHSNYAEYNEQTVDFTKPSPRKSRSDMDDFFDDDSFFNEGHFDLTLDSAFARTFDDPFFHNPGMSGADYKALREKAKRAWDEDRQRGTAHEKTLRAVARAREDMEHERAKQMRNHEADKYQMAMGIEDQIKRDLDRARRDVERAKRDAERVKRDAKRDAERVKRDAKRAAERAKAMISIEERNMFATKNTVHDYLFESRYTDEFYSSYADYDLPTKEKKGKQAAERDMVLDAILNDLKRLDEEGDGYWRKDNLITVVASSSLEAQGQRMLAEKIAQGLAGMGSSVLLVNHLDYSSYNLSDPVATSTDNVYAWTFKGSVDKNLLPMCEKFDYVIVCHFWTSPEDYNTRMPSAKADAVFFAGRVLFCGQALPSRTYDADLIKRSFYIPVARSFIALTMNEKGIPQAHGDGFRRPDHHNLVPQDIDIPVIAACYPDVDVNELAKAVIGIGDPKRFYVDYDQAKMVVRAVHFRDTFAIRRKSDALIVIPGMSVFGGMVTGLAAIALESFIAGVGVTSSVVIALSGALVHARKTAMNEISTEKSSERREKDIYPPNSLIRFQIAAPALGMTHDTAVENMSGAMYMSDLLWAKIMDRYQSVKDRWAEYEFDITKMLDAPLMVDYTCETTAALARATRKADDLKAAVDNERERGGRSVATLRGLFNDAVVDMEVTFEAAEQHATKVGITGFAEAERKRIARSRQLFAVAADTGSSEHERQQALTAATKELKGVLNIPQQTLARIEATARLQITAEPS